MGGQKSLKIANVVCERPQSQWQRCRALANRSRWIEMATVRLALIEYGDKKGQFLDLDPQETSQLSPCGELA